MSEIHLVLNKEYENSKIPIEAEVITPDKFNKKTIDEIKQLPIWWGNKKKTLGEIFSIKSKSFTSEDVESIEIKLTGNLAKVKRIGQEMSNGLISINGNVGMHLGFQMKGGKISVNGNVDDFAGANMKGGEIEILGDTGHYLGGSSRGNWRGMSGGKISVSGSVGNECCVWMRKGFVEIKGNATMFLGMHMHRGLIITHGDVTERAGAEMTGGIIVINGKLQKNLPSFEYQKIVEEIDLGDYGKLKGRYLEFCGDFAERKQGKMYLLEKNNKHHIV